MDLKITVLGSGTSTGVPTIGCTCAVCRSEDERDKRLRPSILISWPGRNVIIDTTPDFRTQILRARVERLDAVLFTHSHADHIMGLDDVRPFNFHQRQRLPIYGSPATLAVIERVFAYVFDNRERKTAIPQLDVHRVDSEPFDVLDLRVEPVPVMHGTDPILGYRFGKAAYLTDHSEIPEASMEKLQGLDVLFLDALRHRPHPTHSTIAASVALAQTLGAKRTFFTHMSHDLQHAETQAALPPGIFLAWDGLEIELKDAA